MGHSIGANTNFEQENAGWLAKMRLNVSCLKAEIGSHTIFGRTICHEYAVCTHIKFVVVFGGDVMCIPRRQVDGTDPFSLFE